MINSWDGVHIHEYETRNHLVFAVYRNGQRWKRLLPRHGGGALWVEGNGARVSGQIVTWLDGILQRSGELPRVQRFPRCDRSSDIAK